MWETTQTMYCFLLYFRLLYIIIFLFPRVLKTYIFVHCFFPPPFYPPFTSLFTSTPPFLSPTLFWFCHLVSFCFSRFNPYPSGYNIGLFLPPLVCSSSLVIISLLLLVLPFVLSNNSSEGTSSLKKTRLLTSCRPDLCLGCVVLCLLPALSLC